MPQIYYIMVLALLHDVRQQCQHHSSIDAKVCELVRWTTCISMPHDKRAGKLPVLFKSDPPELRTCRGSVSAGHCLSLAEE